MKEHKIQIDKAECIGCGLCRSDCPVNNIVVTKQKAEIISQDCIKCGHCVAICPKAAVSMTGFDEPPMEIKEPASLDPQQLLAAIRTRRSVRRFTDQRVSSQVIRQIIEAGRLTPTGGNAQDVSYVVLTKEIAKYEKIAVRIFRRLLPLAKVIMPSAKNMAIDDHFFFKNAPAVILVLAKDPVNGALAASNMERMAQAWGLGVLYSGFFSMAANLSPALRRSFGIGRGRKAVTALVIGYPGVKYFRTAQKERAVIKVL